MLRCRALLCICCLLFCLALGFAKSVGEERLIGWKGEVHRGKGETKQLRGGGVPKRSGAAPKRRRWIEQIATKPRAYLYHGLLSEEECTHIIKVSRPRLRRSLVVDPITAGEKLDDIRTSYGTFLDIGQTPTVGALEKRIAEWSQVPVANQEQLQVLRYGIGQQYRDHWDYFEEATLKKAGAGGQRVATVLMFLTEVDQGGETVFPYQDTEWFTPEMAARAENFSSCAKRGPAVKPMTGDAILFWSLDTNGTEDKNSLHASCPVIRGEKWTATKWLHVGEFPHPELRWPNECEDRDKECPKWAEKGECKNNLHFMLGVEGYDGMCIKSCCGPIQPGVPKDECMGMCGNPLL